MHRPAGDVPFVRRFHAVRGAVLRMQLLQGVCWGVFLGGGAVLSLAAADYAWELSWNVRVIGLAVGVGLAVAIAAAGILRPLLWWTRPRTAREIEARFPQLGQRVRTVLQFSGRDPTSVAGDGVQPTLVTALEEETDLETQPLDLHQIVPRRQATVAAAVAVLPVLLLLAGLLLDWQWRLAIGRALLGDSPYTTLAVAPGDALLDQGHDLTLSLTLSGRVDRIVTLLTRRAGDPQADWEARELGPAEIGHRESDGRRLEYLIALEKVAGPFDYRFVAGPVQGDLHHVAIRYPLVLAEFEATLAPPPYTGLSPRTVPGGDLDVIEDSEIGLRLQFDRECGEAYLLVRDPPYKDRDAGESSAVRVPLEPSGVDLVAKLRLRDDKLYSIVATAREGASLPENQYRIRVRKDQAPRVQFEDPPEAWEVNPIAEVLMRIRVDDDFGLTEAGIVFQIDNGPEQHLVIQEFPGAESADPRAESQGPDAETGQPAAESRKAGFPLTTRAVLEELLCLEEFPVTETSAVTYYGYVEDNYPGKPRRTETDLRFLEIRPFLRIFKVGGS